MRVILLLILIYLLLWLASRKRRERSKEETQAENKSSDLLEIVAQLQEDIQKSIRKKLKESMIRESRRRAEKFLLSPRTFQEYVGNEEAKAMLKIMMDSAKKEGRVLENILLYGNPGLGKKTLAKVLANEIGAELIETTGGTVSSQRRLLQLMWEIWDTQQEGKPVILFVENIHRLSCGEITEEMWYPIFENYCIYHDLKGKKFLIGGLECTITEDFFQCNPFTIIGATTDPGRLTSSLREKFKVSITLHEYSPEELKEILRGYISRLDFKVSEEALVEIAKRGRGNPHQTIAIFEMCKKTAIAEEKEVLDRGLTLKVLRDILKLDETGLSTDEIKVLKYLARMGEKGAGIRTLASELNINIKTLEEVIFPFLLQRGFVETTNKRRITEKGLRYLQR